MGCFFLRLDRLFSPSSPLSVAMSSSLCVKFTALWLPFCLAVDTDLPPRVAVFFLDLDAGSTISSSSSFSSSEPSSSW